MTPSSRLYIQNRLLNIKSVKSLTTHQNQSPFYLPAGKQRMGEVKSTSTDFGFGLQLPLAVSTVAAVFQNSKDETILSTTFCHNKPTEMTT